MIKRRIHGTNYVVKQVENIAINIANDNQAKRSTIALADSSANATIIFPHRLNMNDIEPFPSIASLLYKYYNTSAVSTSINCARSLQLGKHIIVDSTFDPPPRKKKLPTHALVNCVRRSSLPLLVKVLLAFQHKHSGVMHSLAICQVYQNVTVGASGIPECHWDTTNSNTLNRTWDLDVMALDDFLSSVAVLESDISRKLFFVWPDMRRIGLKVYNDDTIFDFTSNE